MALCRPRADLVFDNPGYRGTPVIGSFGWGLTWPFRSSRQDTPTDPSSFSPVWRLQDTEIIPGMAALQLRGTAPPATMSLGEWEFDQSTEPDNWRLDYPDLFPAVPWLAWCDATPGSGGYALSTDDNFALRLAVHLVDFAPAADQTLDPVYTAIDLRSDETADTWYTIALPLHSATYKYPQLLRGIPPDQEVVDEFERADVSGGAEGGVNRRTVWIEERDGCLVIRLGDAAEPWVYEFPAATPPSGKVGIKFVGHQGCANVVKIAYPPHGYADTIGYLQVPELYSVDAGYVVNPVVAWKDTALGQDVFATQSFVDRGMQLGVTVERYAGLPNDSPIVYGVSTEVRPEWAAPDSDPVSTQETAEGLGDLDSAELQRVEWRRNLYRDWTLRATFRDPHDFWRGYLATINRPVAVNVAVDDAELTQIMVGYTTRPVPRREQDRECTVVDVSAQDYIMARLAGRKFLRRQPGPIGWDLGLWAETVLANANCTAETDFPSGTVVEQTRKRDAQWLDFTSADELVPFMDRVFKAHGWTPLRVTSAGVLTSGPEPVYGGTPDFTLDEATATGDNRIERVEVDFNDLDFRNAAVALGLLGELGEEIDATSLAEIADDWWAVAADEENATPADRAEKLLAERLLRGELFTWSRELLPTLEPGMFVEVTVDGLGVAPGTVYKVVADEGTLDCIGCRGTSTFYLEKVEVPE